MTAPEDPTQGSRRSPGRYLYSWALIFSVPLSLTFLRKWLDETFGQFTLEQFLFHLRYGSEGLLAGNVTLAVDFLREVVLVPASYTIPIVGGIILISRTLRDELRFNTRDATRTIIRYAVLGTWVVCVAAGLARYIYRSAASVSADSLKTEGSLSKAFEYMGIEPALYVLSCSAVLILAVLLVQRLPLHRRVDQMIGGVLTIGFMFAFSAACLFCLLSLFPASSYADLLSTPSVESFIDRNYATPVAERKGDPQNLVIVYVESLEASYDDIEGGDLLGALNLETADWQNVSDFTQVYGTGWTTAALVASQCGLPLRPPVGTFDRPNDSINLRDAILPQAICLGDLLRREGYDNVFLTGSSLDFGGLGTFVSNHGYSVARGREDWIAAGEDDISEWGLTDDRLFERAKSEFKQLQARGAPFNLTILTIDNHGPDGILNPTCKSAGVDSFAKILRCNSRLVADFLKFVREQGPSTAIVVMGDHLVHENPLLPELEALPKRHVYGRIWAPGEARAWRTLVSHFDFYPSIVEMTGLALKDRRAGLGTSFMGEPLTGFTNPLSSADYDAQLQAKSALYTDLWKSDQATHSLP